MISNWEHYTHDEITGVFLGILLWELKYSTRYPDIIKKGYRSIRQYLIISKDSLRIYRTPRSNIAINTTFPNNELPRTWRTAEHQYSVKVMRSRNIRIQPAFIITSLQMKIVDNMLLEEFLSAVLPSETDILTSIVMVRIS
jgi:hypothetical protein